MTQKDRDLLLKDLSARLPYSVKVYDTKGNFNSNYQTLVHINGPVGEAFIVNGLMCRTAPITDLKPYLFPLSNITDELWDKEFVGCGITEFTRDSFKYGCETLEFNNSNPNLSNMIKFINLLIKNHFDIYGLIPMGLAIDATNLNVY